MAAGSRGLILQTWIIVFLVVISVFMILRLWAARVSKRQVFADDVFSVIGYVSNRLPQKRHASCIFYIKVLLISLVKLATISSASVTIWAIYHGAGEHMGDLPREDIALLSMVRMKLHLGTRYKY